MSLYEAHHGIVRFINCLSRTQVWTTSGNPFMCLLAIITGPVYLLIQGFSKCGKVSLPSENITAAPPLPIIIAIITIIVVVAIMQGYSIAFQRGPVREHVIKCSVFAVYLSLFWARHLKWLFLSSCLVSVCVWIYRADSLTAPIWLAE